MTCECLVTIRLLPDLAAGNPFLMIESIIQTIL